MNGDEYMALLLERQAEHMAASSRSTDGRITWPNLPPLLEWFIRPGDENLFTPPKPTPQPKRATTPRVHRSAASLREERDRLIALRDPLVTPLLNDRAASHGQALGHKGTARIQKREDSRLRRYVELDKRIQALDGRIARAERREAQ